MKTEAGTSHASASADLRTATAALGQTWDKSQPDPVEVALPEAVAAASAAGRWDVVPQLARELEARRLDTTWRAGEDPDVVDLDAARKRKEGLTHE